MFIQAAKTGEVDLVRGPSANVMLGQHGFYGTSSFDVVLDLAPLKDIVKPQRTRYSFRAETPKLADLASLDMKNDLAQILAESVAVVAPESDYSIDL